MFIARVGLVLLMAVAAGCTTQTVEEPDDGNREGDACSTDLDCNGIFCSGGVCTAATVGSSGSVSGAGSSGGGHSSSVVTSSGGAADGGTPDASVPSGHIVLSPDGTGGPVEFGATRVGASVTQNVLVTNDGVAPATIITLGFRNNLSGEFTLSVVNGQPASLLPGEQLTLRITHTATDATEDNAFLSVVTNASNPLVEVPLVAAFKGDAEIFVADAPDSAVEVTTLQVPPTPAGTPVVAHVFVKNVGQADSALSVTSIALNPPASALFTVSGGPLPRAVSQWPGLCMDLGLCGPGASSCTGGLCVADGATGTYPQDVVDVAITFNAGAPGEATTELVITADVAGAQEVIRIPVVALAQDSRLEVTPSPIAFENVFLNRTRSLQVTLKNPDDAPNALEVTSLGIRFTPAPYSVELDGLVLPFPLTPGSSVVVRVVFAPTNPGNFNNSFAVGRADGLPIYVPITGSGVNEPVADVPGALDFGGVIPGTPKTLPLRIGNTGFGPLSVSMISVTPLTAPFSVNLTSLPDVAGMGFTNALEITYAPTMNNSQDAATLLLVTNDPNRPLIQVALTGQGVIPIAAVTPTGVDFGAVLINTLPVPPPPPTRVFTVRNDGPGTLVVNSPLEVRNAANALIPQYQVTGSRMFPANVNSGDSMTVTVAFSPTAPQFYTGNLTITTNDPMRPTFTLQVTGSGHNCAALPNTSVTVVNGTMCAYMCVAASVQCSDMSCVSCPARHAADRSCTSPGGVNTCTYTCPASTGETVEPSGSCASAHQLREVDGAMEPFPGFVIQDGSPIDATGFRIYPNSDHDWFRFRMADRQDWLEGSPGAFLRATVRLSNVASGEQLAFEVLEDSCASGGTPTVVSSGQTGEYVGRRFCDRSNGTDANDNPIPRDDGRYYYIHVYPQGTSYQCTSYRLEIEVEEVGFFGSLSCL